MKTYQSWLLGALACATIVPFTGCTKDEMVGPNGGNGETFETELTIALSSRSGVATKATDQEIQADGSTFNGITNISLLSYAKDVSSDNYAPEEASTVLSKRSLTAIPAVASPEENYVTHRDAIELNPVNQGFLFYGQNAYSSSVGKIKATIPETGGNISDTKFELVDISTTNNATDPGADPVGYYKAQMDSYLKEVYIALYNYNQDYVIYNEGASQSVKDIYNSLNAAKSGSFVQIADLMAQLYVLAGGGNVILPSGASSTGSLVDIKNKIYDYATIKIFKETPTTTGSGTIELLLEGLSYEPIETGLATIFKDNNILEGYYELEFCNKNNGEGAEFLKTSSNKYTYPLALYYYINTYPIDYSDNNFESLGWSASGLINDYSDPAVMTTQPSKIALAHSVQYAVGRLDVNLTFDDNLTDYKNNTVNKGDLTLKAVLIGNQKAVNWNFTPISSEVEKVIYDNEVNNLSTKVLAFPTTSEAAVNIALELEYNNAEKKSFIGANGQKIPSGSTFYVVGELDPTDLTTITSNPDQLKSVFVSDYTTTANLTLKSVKTAQNTVPDLSGTNLEFALSVDLKWNSGIVFNVPIE